VKNEEIIENNASHYFSQAKIISPKYLRKFAFDKMIELEVPESVADFIEGSKRQSPLVAKGHRSVAFSDIPLSVLYRGFYN